MEQEYIGKSVSSSKEDIMNTYESYSKEEIQEFFDAQRPSFWWTETRINPENMQTIYVLKWC